MNIDWQFLLVASFGTTGIIQWLKGVTKKPKNPWSYLSPIFCFGMALLVKGSWQNIILNTVLVLSISQLGYDVLVKPVKRLLGIEEKPKEEQKTATPTPKKPVGVTPGVSQGFSVDLSEILKTLPDENKEDTKK